MSRTKHAWTVISLCAALGCSFDEPDAATSMEPGIGAGGQSGVGAAGSTAGASGSAQPGVPDGSRAGAGASAGAGGGSSGASGQGGAGAADGGSGPSGAGGESSGASGEGGSAGSGMCVGDWEAGDYPPGIATETYLEITGVAGQNDLTRQYKVHVPPSYDCTKPAPVLFCLHGLGQTPVMFCVNGSAMPEKSDEGGFILVMPFGYQNSWNGAGCCGGAASAGLDDVALMRAILADVQEHLNVDSKRVYVTGLSNGGYMSYRLACEAADVFAAAAPGAGGLQGMHQTSCSPSEPISLLDIHGTADGLVPYSLQAPSLLRFANQNGCTTTTKPAAQPESRGAASCVSYDGCPNGIEVTGCTVQGGGHVWFGDPTCGTGADGACAIVGANSMDIDNTDAIWDFFSRQSK
jgi:polyhydroxybutyrate depolymerase